MGRRLILMLWCVAASGNAQWQLNRQDSEKVNRALDAARSGDQLKCHIRPIEPFLDFSFRFDAGYIASCPVKEFDGKRSLLIAYTRIVPDGGAPVVLGSAYQLPEIPPWLAERINLQRVNTNFDVSGGFVLGEGRYKVDVMLTDGRNRSCHAHWTLKSKRNHHEMNAPVALAPNTAAAYPLSSWEGKSDGVAPPGSRLTILLDAAPMIPSSMKLRAWDRAFLLDSLTSLLRQTPAESVRLIAFNLDQQREIFRQDHFDRAGFAKLSNALSRLELGAVSYKVLQRQAGSAELLAKLVNEQNAQPPSSDTVVFLGPAVRNTEKVPETMLLPCRPDSPQFFYLEYFPMWRLGREFPDAIHSAVRACNGKVLKIHSPGELAEAIRKMNDRVAAAHAPADSSGGSTWTRESLRTN